MPRPTDQEICWIESAKGDICQLRGGYGPQATTGPFSSTPKPFNLLAAMAWDVNLRNSHRLVGYSLGRVDSFGEELTQHLKKKCLDEINSYVYSVNSRNRGRHEAVEMVRLAILRHNHIFIKDSLWDMNAQLENTIKTFEVTDESLILPLIISSFDRMIKERFIKKNFHNLASLDAALVKAAADETFTCLAIGDALQLVRLASEALQEINLKLLNKSHESPSSLERFYNEEREKDWELRKKTIVPEEDVVPVLKKRKSVTFLLKPQEGQ